MPILTLITNVDQNKVNENILKDASKLMGDLFDGTEQVSKAFHQLKACSINYKNFQNVFVSIKAGVKMQWGTKPGLFALGTIQNTTPFHAESSKEYAPQVFEFVEKALGIPQNRLLFF